MNKNQFNRRHFLKTAGLSLSAFLAANSLFCSKKIKISRPNILLILADDLGWSDLGCYGGEIDTPNLDRLAAGGIRFTQMHNTAKCFPSRACLLTGLYAQQCGMDKKAKSSLKNAVTLAEVLKTAGYRTLMAGKYHGLDNPYDRGFDRYFGLRDGACNHFNPGKQREGEGKPAQKRPNRFWCVDDKIYSPYTPQEKDFYTTDYFTKYALSYLEEYKNEDKPFFLYLAYTAPHDPLMAWPEDIQKYRGKYAVGYEAIRQQRFARQKEMGLIDNNFPLSEKTYPDWESLSEEEKSEEDLKMAVYAAMIDRLDQNVGKVLDKTKEIGREKNTLVIFLSDNGCSAEVVKIAGSGEIGTMTRWTSLGRNWANVSNTPFRLYKNYTHEGGICTPFIVYWPNQIKKGGQIKHTFAHFIDFMPTFLELTGAQYPQNFKGEGIYPFAGESFLPAIKGDRWERKKPVFWQWSKGRGVRRGRWKLVSWNGEWELYDMERDKTETKNLAKEFPQVVAELSGLFEDWRERLPDIL